MELCISFTLMNSILTSRTKGAILSIILPCDLNVFRDLFVEVEIVSSLTYRLTLLFYIYPFE